MIKIKRHPAGINYEDVQVNQWFTYDDDLYLKKDTYLGFPNVLIQFRHENVYPNIFPLNSLTPDTKVELVSMPNIHIELES